MTVGLKKTAALLLLLTASVEAKPFVAKSTTKSKILSLRGGDLGSIQGETLAKTFSALVACDAIGGCLFPKASMNMVGVNMPPGSAAESHVHSLGVSAASLSLATFLTVSGKASLDQALGTALAARLLSITYLIATKKTTCGTVGSGIMWLAHAFIVYSLFQGDASLGKTLAQVLCMLYAFLGAKDYLKPASSGLAAFDGGYLATSSATLALLASGMDPVKATGYSILGFVPTVVKALDVVTVRDFFGVDLHTWSVVIFGLLGAIFAGTVL